MSRLKVITLCSGYDAQCLALQRLGIDFDLWWSEIDKYAIQAHNVRGLCVRAGLTVQK
jgi:site-specific DNA-cytosine methylase